MSAERAYVWIDPGRQGGVPCVGGTRLPTSTVAANLEAGTVAQVCDWYVLTRPQVIVACWFEWQHADGRSRKGKWVRTAYPQLWKGNYDAVPDPPEHRTRTRSETP